MAGKRKSGQPIDATLPGVIEDACDRFEAAWREGSPPDIREYLTRAELPADAQRQLVAALIGIDLEYRWRRACARLTPSLATAMFQPDGSTQSALFPARPTVEDYLQAFPELQRTDDLLPTLVADEYRTRHVWGDHPEHDEYARRFPDSFERLRPVLAAADAAQPETPASVVLEVVRGQDEGKKFTFDRHGTFLIGRAAEVHLRFAQDRRVSSYHARLEVNPPECYLADLGSRNGTFVNGSKVRDKLLADGDVITIGTNEIAVSTASPTDTPARLPDDVEPPDETGAFPNVILPPGYRLVREVGRGGMGVVYEAVHDNSGQRVAIKSILAGRGESDRQTQLFLREASVLSQLRHKRIVEFRECSMLSSRFHLVMELVDAIDLSAYLATQPDETRIRYYCGIICQVLEALAFAHDRGLVHRDIKPSNILVTRSGRRLRTKLADFGLAKSFETAGLSAMTRDGELRGTLPFMPPEQIVDSRTAKPTSDIYSTGATLYYYLAGRYPHDFTDSTSAFAVVLQRSPTPLMSIRENLPEGLAFVVHKSLARDSAKRFGSATEMFRALYPYAKAQR